jgi:hypothetical protein
VRLDILTIQGKSIGTIVDENQPGGRHHAGWDAVHCAPGVYLGRLEIDREILVKKFLLR